MISVRIYNSGNYVINNVRPEHLDDHIDYNKTYRFGCALVVGGEIKNEGYLDKERILDIYSKIDLSRYSNFTTPPYA